MDGMSEGRIVDVVVVGAGYAGLLATNRLLGSLRAEERSHVRVRVVNPRAGFVERIRLHELVAGTRSSVERPLGDILHADAELMVGTVRVIDPDARTITVDTGGGRGDVVVGYDFLIYAVGSKAAAPTPGAREHGFLLADYEGALDAARAIAAGPADQRIVVVGGGFTGVEAASELAEAHPAASVVVLAGDQLVPTMRSASRRTLKRRLRALGADVREHSRVASIEPGGARLADGTFVVADVCVIAASFDVPELARASGLAIDETGRLRVDETLRSLDAPTIIGAGDAVVVPDTVGRHLRMSCAAALPLGGYAAEAVLHLLRGEEPRPISVGFVVQCLSVGRRSGYVQAVHRDDTPRPFHVGGRPAARIKEWICTMVVDAPTAEREHPNTYRTTRGPHRVAA